MSATTTIQKTFTSDTYIGDLWVLCGSPSGQQIVSITADNCDLGEVIITADWTLGTTFQFNILNGGRICGIGGDGGAGGDDNGTWGTKGLNGTNGAAALASVGFPINIDIDNGFLLGGAGGGGGGSSFDSIPVGPGGDADPGCGGGGGAGFSITSGGPAGSPTGTPIGTYGANGGSAGPGAGGVPGGGDATTQGGRGGNWGACGEPGYNDRLANMLRYGGVGGYPGKAFDGTGGATLTYTGAKSEATLRSENRIEGQTIDPNLSLIDVYEVFIANPGVGGTAGFIFDPDGQLTWTNDVDGDYVDPVAWHPSPPSDADFGDEYEITLVNRTGSNDYWEFGTDPGWNGGAPADNVFDSLSLTATIQMSHTGPVDASQTIQLACIRRADVGGNPADGGDPDQNALAYFYLYSDINSI
jgi:hypothetical protein